MAAQRLGAAAFFFTAAAFAVSAHAGEWTRDGRRNEMRRDFALAGAQSVRVDLRWGELHVEPADGDSVEVILRVECRHFRDECEDRLHDIDIDADKRHDQLQLEVVGLSHWGSHGLDVEVIVRVPRGKGLEIDMGAGEVHIDDHASDLKVHLGAGEIGVRMPAGAVRDVRLDAGVGDASLRLHHHEIEADRHHLIGCDLEWDEGEGRAHVDCHVGAGEVAMRLE